MVNQKRPIVAHPVEWAVFAILLSLLMWAPATATTTTQIIVDPRTGLVIDRGEAVIPLYESTLRLETRYYVTCGSYWEDMGSDLGPPITAEEIPSLGEKELQFSQNACCCAIPEAWSCPRDRSSLKLCLTVYDPKVADYQERYKEYTLFQLAFRTIYEMGWSEAAGVLYTGSSRAFVTQIGRLKVLSIVRAIALTQTPYPCPTDADFALDVYVAIFAANVDILLQARRNRTWP